MHKWFLGIMKMLSFSTQICSSLPIPRDLQNVYCKHYQNSNFITIFDYCKIRCLKKFKIIQCCFLGSKWILSLRKILLSKFIDFRSGEMIRCSDDCWNFKSFRLIAYSSPHMSKVLSSFFLVVSEKLDPTPSCVLNLVFTKNQ